MSCNLHFGAHNHCPPILLSTRSLVESPFFGAHNHCPPILLLTRSLVEPPFWRQQYTLCWRCKQCQQCQQFIAWCYLHLWRYIVFQRLQSIMNCKYCVCQSMTCSAQRHVHLLPLESRNLSKSHATSRSCNLSRVMQSLESRDPS